METSPISRPQSFHDFVAEKSSYGDTTVDRSALIGQYTNSLIEYRRSIGIDNKGVAAGIEIAGVLFDVEQATTNNN